MATTAELPTDENTLTDDPKQSSAEASKDTPQENLSEVTKSVNTDDSTWKDRYGNLKSYHDKEKNQNNARIKELETALLEAKKAKLPSSEEEIQALAQENPKLLDAMTRLIGENALTTKAEIQKELQAVKEAQEQLRIEEGFKQVLEAHPDALAIRSSEEFRAWLETQPEDVKNIPFNPNSSARMIKLLFDDYKQDMNISQTVKETATQEKREQIENSKSATKSNSAINIAAESKAMLYDEAKKQFKDSKTGRTDWGKIREMAKKGQLIR